MNSPTLSIALAQLVAAIVRAISGLFAKPDGAPHDAPRSAAHGPGRRPTTFSLPVVVPSERRADMGLADSGSIIPPNVERAVRAVLSTSGRLALSAAELERFLVGLGLPRGDARAVVVRTTARTLRSQVGDADLAELQTLVTRTWIDAHARADHGAFIQRLGLELGVELDLELDDAAITSARTRACTALVGRGWSRPSAETIVASALGRAASLLLLARTPPARACA